MNERLAILGVLLAALSGVPGLLLDRRSRRGEWIAVLLLGAATIVGLVGAIRALAVPATESPFRIAWAVPGASLVFAIDALSAMFLVPIFTLGFLGAIYGLGYWSQPDRPDSGRKLRLFYGLIVAGMALLVIARSAVLFLFGWEIMAIAAFLTITTEDETPSVREVGYIYLAATRIGTLAVIATFALLATALGHWELTGVIDARTPLAAGVFIAALLGFGLKAGVMPLHVWLPGAHASAPSHVSALMSGVLIKVGIYGLLRVLSLFSSPPLWWGLVVLALGLVSGVLGVAFAIGQHDLKRLLAYHSVENIGIICLGIGLALLGRSTGRPLLVTLGLAGALLHVWNHGLFKALLFLAAGSIIHATGTREIDHLGGLGKRMPWTSLWFLVGAVAICGLPPLNGFISELFVYVGLIDVTAHSPGAVWLAGALAASLLALIGALAVACFVKVFGAVFLGEPRSRTARVAHEAPRTMTGPMATLAALCIAIGLGARLIAPVLDHAARAWAPELATTLAASADAAPLSSVALVYLPLLALLALLGTWLVRRGRGPRSDAVTWDCGYAAPDARMQYTASSFAQMVVGMFRWALRPHVERAEPSGPFPAATRFVSHVPDTVLEGLMIPTGKAAGRQLRWVLWLQRGSSHAYLLYILATLVLLLLWKGG